MDLIIAVDTGVMHLAAACGRPVWHLARSPGDWRWSIDEAGSPWYPSMRIFRQKEAGDWASVLAEVRSALTTWREQSKVGASSSRRRKTSQS
jgi:ADP-heptose:LPS heptosyltransferase